MKHLSLSKLENIQTPFYLFDVHHLNNQIDCIKNAFTKYWHNYVIAYSLKTNSLPSLCKQMLLQKNVMAEVVSEDEYNLARSVGFNANNIVCNGPIKSESWLISIVESSSILNIDSKSEVSFLCDYASKHPLQTIKIGIRVNNDIEDIFPHASTAGVNGSRFGFSYESGELGRIINILSSYSNVKIAGLHLHTSTNLRSLDVYDYLSECFCQIVSQFKLSDIEYFDIGGGFYGEVPGKPNWDDYLKAISVKLNSKGYSPEKLKLIIEPGVSLLAGCFSYYCRVTDTKDTMRMRFVQLDGTRLHVDPLMHKTLHSYFYEIEQVCLNSTIIPAQTLVGNTCLEYDTLFTLNEYPELKKGDLIRFDKIGAYTMTLSPLFITWFPLVLQINDDDSIEVVRDRWKVEEFLQKSNL